MRRSLFFVTLVMFIVGLGTTLDSIASQPETTLVLRVRSAEASKSASFSGTIRFDTSSTPIQLNNQRTPFGIKAKASTLTASFQKLSGDSELFVELIEFNDEREVSSITKTGISFEVGGNRSPDGSSFRIH